MSYGQIKMTEELKMKIKKMIDEKIPLQGIAKRIGMSYPVVWRIKEEMKNKK